MEPWPLNPITDETFERQGWEMNVERDEGEEYYFYTLPLQKIIQPKSPVLISSCNDDYKDLNKKR